MPMTEKELVGRLRKAFIDNVKEGIREFWIPLAEEKGEDIFTFRRIEKEEIGKLESANTIADLLIVAYDILPFDNIVIIQTLFEQAGWSTDNLGPLAGRVDLTALRWQKSSEKADITLDEAYNDLWNRVFREET